MRTTRARAGAAAVAAVCIGLLSACSPGDPSVPTGTGSAPAETTTPGSPSATATPQPSVTPTDAPSASLPAEEAASVVYPAPGESDFVDPESAVGGFTADYAEFAAPEISDYMQGDSRSGEFEVSAGGNRVTTVLVRQMSDDAWYVIGSTTPDIQVAEPVSGAAISSPVTVGGEAVAFEGNVVVQVRGVDGDVLGQEPVTGSGGPDLGPFSGDIAFTDPGSGQGAVLFLTYSAMDGSLEQVVAVPVGFGG
ncbi:Gmad2 immunoglobulin-like domain-containing protein [Zhihengliuella halotolerans]|uniref:Gmad2 immunoglobulin-like domain-containing protein n=1 Tax=Zhihengliuella halotolerans TaxID=370736 RepID=UPI00102B564A|nr:Gmad2 immunoglobulin-like domain-containing protein [Zhihengliuella halotolerans]